MTGDLSPVAESHLRGGAGGEGALYEAVTVTRSRTLPSRKQVEGEGSGSAAHAAEKAKVLRKQKRASSHARVPLTAGTVAS